MQYYNIDVILDKLAVLKKKNVQLEYDCHMSIEYIHKNNMVHLIGKQKERNKKRMDIQSFQKFYSYYFS